MTEYSLPDKPEDTPHQDKLINIPPESLDRDYMSPKTWRDREQAAGVSPSETEVTQLRESVGQYLGRFVLKTETARGERDNFITSFRWIPYSQAEATIALQKLPTHTSIARRTKQGSGERAVERAFNSVDKFRSDAVTTIHTLREALTSLDEDDNQPSVDLIKQNAAVRSELVNYMFAKESLDNFHWHNRKTNKGPNRKTTERLQRLDRLIDEAGDEELVRLWQQTLVANQLRLKFWAGQVELAKDEHGTSHAARVTARNILEHIERDID